MWVGIDLVEIHRIAKSMENPRFLTRVFGPSERELFCAPRGAGPRGVERAAANFAAKEAFGKALGTGVRGFALAEVETLRDDQGAPYLKLSGRAAEIARQRGLRFAVSLTHTKEYAQAIVIACAANETEAKGGMEGC